MDKKQKHASQTERTRRHFTPADKVATLKRHLLEGVAVSALCDELGIGPNLFYRWQKEFFENGHVAFENARKSKTVDDAQQRKIDQLQAKLTRKNEVLSELMEEHVQLKKELGEPWPESGFPTTRAIRSLTSFASGATRPSCPLRSSSPG